MMPLFYLPDNEQMLLRTARTFKALKIALRELAEFYTKLLSEPDTDHQLNAPYFETYKRRRAKVSSGTPTSSNLGAIPT